MNTARDKKRRQTRDRVRKHRAVQKLRRPISGESESDYEHEPESAPENLKANLGTVEAYGQDSDSCGNELENPAEPADCNSTSPKSEASATELDQSSCYSDGHDTPVSAGSNTENEDNNIPSETEDEGMELEDELHEIRKWAIEHNITQTQLDSLLLILRRRLLPNLPKTAKTLLGTSSAAYDIRIMEDSEGNAGEFVYLGITDQLRAYFNPKTHSSDSIELQINVDGMSLFESGTMQLWPILFKVVNESDIYKPLPAAIYAGHSKPKDLHEYLTQFVTEINDLTESGIIIEGKLFKVSIQCFICDTPARSFLKCTKGHTGYFACERCEVRGCRSGNTIVYPQVDCPIRTDESFRRQSQRQHHQGISPLLQLWPTINMIVAFILDFMHLCCIGVMKKLIQEFWVRGDRHIKLVRRARLHLSRRLEFLKPQVPSEFQRKPRAVKYVAKWKATEFRFFLLYCGPVVLKGLLYPKLHKHFLLFHAACRILCHEDLAVKYNRFAKKYLTNFVLLLKEYYGPNSQVINAHNLIHAADDAKNFNCSISKLTAFPFENALGRLRNYVRTPNRPLAQICRRLHELTSISKRKPTVPPLVKIMNQSAQIDEATKCRRITKLKFRGYVLSTKSPDDTVLLKSGTILKIEYMTYCEDRPKNITVYGKKWKKKRSLLTYPCDSKILESWVMHATYSTIKILCSLDDIQRKMVVMHLPDKKNEAYASSLLHY